MRLRPFQPSDLDNIDTQEEQAFEGQYFAPDMVAAACAYGFTLEHEGIIIGCGGIVPLWQGRSVAWTLLSVHVKRHMVVATKYARAALESCGVARVEMYVKKDFPQGHRWARMLGFDLEAETMRAFYPDGSDFSLYARTKKWHN